MILNNKLVFANDFYAVAKSHDGEKICYITRNKSLDLLRFFYDKFQGCSFISLSNEPFMLYTITSTVLTINTFLDDINKVSAKSKDSNLFIIEHGGQRLFVVPIYYYKGIDNKRYCFSDHRFYVDSGDVSGKAGYLILSYEQYKTSDIQETVCSFCETLDLYCNGNAYTFTVYNQEDQENPIQQEHKLLHPCDFLSYVNDYYFNLSSNDMYFKEQLKVYI